MKLAEMWRWRWWWWMLAGKSALRNWRDRCIYRPMRFVHLWFGVGSFSVKNTPWLIPCAVFVDGVSRVDVVSGDARSGWVEVFSKDCEGLIIADGSRGVIATEIIYGKVDVQAGVGGVT